MEKIAVWEHSVMSTTVLPKSAQRKRSRYYWETRVKSKETIKNKNIWTKKNHLLLQISAVIGKYGPHLIIVMTVVTQNNF